MRLNKYIAQASGLSRRAADDAIAKGRVLVNTQKPVLGQTVTDTDTVTLDGSTIIPGTSTTIIMLHKPVGYVCSRDGQGSQTVYDILPNTLHHLKPIGRLDKDSSGLLLLTDDGNLAHQLTHPSFQKTKIYIVTINKPLTPEDQNRIEKGVTIDNYISSLELAVNKNGEPKTVNRSWIVSMSMGRNRQIRRTFEALGYRVNKLHRVQFGDYTLDNLKPGKYQVIS